MELSNLWPAVRRWAWVMILFACASMALAGFIAMRTPHFEASATVVTRQQTSNNGQTLDFADIATSNAVTVKALQDSHLDESLDQLQSHLNVVSSRTDLYRVTVGDSTPERATSLANAVATDAAALYQELGGGAKTSVVADLEKDRVDDRDRYLAAAQTLLSFESQHPETVALATYRAASISSSDSLTAANAAAQYREQYLAATQALANYQSAHPEIAKGNATPDVTTQQKQLQLDQQAAQNAYLSLQNAAAQARIAPASPPPNVAPAIQAQWQQLELDQEAAQNAYLSLLTAASQARVAELSAARAFTATVVDPAVARSQNRFLKAAYGGALGFVLGLLFALVLEYLTAPRRQPQPPVPSVSRPGPRRHGRGKRPLIDGRGDDIDFGGGSEAAPALADKRIALP